MRITTVLATLGFALAGATASAQSITYDYDKSADFSKLTSYAWAPSMVGGDDFNHKRIVAAIDSQLATKHIAKAASPADAGMVVVYHAVFDQDTRINAFGTGGAWGFGSRSGSARAEKVVNGTLVIEIFDAKSESLLWRGIARKEIDPKASPEKRDAMVNKTVRKLLDHFPPSKS